MASGSSTTTTSRKVSEKKDGTPIHVGDKLVWWENYRNRWKFGRVIVDEQEIVFIQGADQTFNQLEWAVAEGRIKPHHIFVLNREDFLKSHELEYIRNG